MDKDGENKHKDLIDAIPIMPCQNSSRSWASGSMEIENPDSTEFTRHYRPFGKEPR